MTRGDDDLLEMLATQDFSAAPPVPPVLAFRYRASQGQPGFYTFGVGGSPNVATWIDQGGTAGDATQGTTATQPQISTGAVNGLDAMLFAVSGGRRFAVQGALALLNNKDGVCIRLAGRVNAFPVAAQGQDIFRIDSGTTNVALIALSLMPAGKQRVAVRMEGGSVGTPIAAETFTSEFSIVAGSGFVAIVAVECKAARVKFKTDWRDIQVIQELTNGLPGWEGGRKRFEAVNALVAPSLGRPGGEVDWLCTDFEVWTGLVPDADNEAWWAARQAELNSPLPKVTLTDPGRAWRNRVHRAKWHAGRAQYEATIAVAGTVKAGQANGFVKYRLLDWDTLAPVTTLAELVEVTGDTGVERDWSADVIVPRGAFALEVRLGDEADANAIYSDFGLLVGPVIGADGQSNMKNLAAVRAQFGAFPYTPTREDIKHRRNTGDGWWDMSARIDGGGGIFMVTGEVKVDTLNDGSGGNGTIRLALRMEELGIPFPVGLVFVPVGSSGTETRLPPDEAAGIPLGGVNWQKADAKILADGGAGYDVDAWWIVDGEEEANHNEPYGFYAENQIKTIVARRDLQGEEVPLYLSILGPTQTDAKNPDPDRPGYTFADQVRLQQLQLCDGVAFDVDGVSTALTGCKILDNPLDSERATISGGALDPQHGTWARYENLAIRGLQNFLRDYYRDSPGGPALITSGCQGARLDSVEAVADSNVVMLHFVGDGGTTMRGSASGPLFTGIDIAVDGEARTITATTADGFDVEVTVDGDALVVGQEIAVDILKGNEPDRSNILMDNGDPSSVAQPTRGAMLATVTAPPP
jgi:hypothetical protein